MFPFFQNTMVVFVPSKADEAIRTARIFSYPKLILYLVAGFIAFVSLCHFFSIFYQFITRKRVHGWKRRSSVSLQKVPAAVIDSLRTIAFRWSIPIGSSHQLNLAEVALTLGYMVVLFTSTFVNTTTTTGIKLEPHYYASRAGRLAASQFPIMVALGMKNNFISWLTGVSFTKLNCFHRISARVLCVLTWIHIGGHVAIGLDGNNASVNPWIQWGMVAASAFTLLCLLTIRPIRERSYEIFLLIHFIFAFICILGLYFHLRGRNLTHYGAWPSMTVWGFEHFINLIHLVTINFAYLNPWSSKNSKKELDAMVEVLSPHLVRVTLHRSKYFHWRPGHSAYLSFPSISAFPFESHPFTISTIDNDDSTSGDHLLVFLIGVKGGFTQKLLKAASSDQTCKVFLNGPYGSPPLLMGDQTVILIAGGSGVSFTLPFFLDILRRAKAGKNVCQKVLFIWAIRNSDDIHWIANTLAPALENVPPSLSVTMQLYITGTTDNSEMWEKTLKENGSTLMVNNISDCRSSISRSSSTILQSSLVRFHQGRPDLKLLISKEVDEATGKISINVCGTRSLANAARAAIGSPRPMDVLRGGPTVSFHASALGG